LQAILNPVTYPTFLLNRDGYAIFSASINLDLEVTALFANRGQAEKRLY